MLYNGHRYYKNYEGKGDVVSWVCHNKHVCNHRVKTQGQYVVAILKDHSAECTVQYFTTGRGQIGAMFEGRRFHKNYQGKGDVVSWICHNKTCRRRIRTSGRHVVELSKTYHVDDCIAQFVTTSKGTTILLYNGRRYSKNYQNRGRVSWRCNKPGCMARISTLNDEILTTKNEHNHED
ncbi:unnamed protein product [Chrysodeixis includens]|uniref:FLYWCH-type domain-containing protein n=1 Tax=Chrysodeixis includens TaxID=689277 RepID=A0A9N8PYU2_CHRIL|nr:unnamed protein product [Chrysodeixis includens]